MQPLSTSDFVNKWHYFQK